MAYDAFLQIDGIPGDSLDSHHEQWIEVLSFSWGETNAGRATSAAFGGGGGSGRTSFQDFRFTSLFSKASPKLFLACATGEHIPTATFSLALSTPTTAGAPGSDFLKYTLTNCLVSSYQTGGSLRNDGTYTPIGVNGDGFTGGVPVDQFSLAFAKMEIVYTSQVDASVTDVSAEVLAADN